MCSTFKINGKWCETVGELKKVLGEAVVSCLPPSYQKYGDEDCLCGIDIQKLADGCGQIIVSDGCNYYCGVHINDVAEVDRIPQMQVYPRTPGEIHNGHRHSYRTVLGSRRYSSVLDGLCQFQIKLSERSS